MFVSVCICVSLYLYLCVPVCLIISAYFAGADERFYSNYVQTKFRPALSPTLDSLYFIQIVIHSGMYVKREFLNPLDGELENTMRENFKNSIFMKKYSDPYPTSKVLTTRVPSLQSLLNRQSYGAQTTAHCGFVF